VLWLAVEVPQGDCGLVVNLVYGRVGWALQRAFSDQVVRNMLLCFAVET
jgi:hypothetical protein